jgi:putative spermidine/putrescine transport system permease protein
MQLFTKILAPLLVPGILASAVLVLVRTVGLFELTFLVSGPGSDTLVVAIYRAMTASGGGEARQLVSSMGVLYTLTMMIILVIALRFVNPTQLVARVKDANDD